MKWKITFLFLYILLSFTSTGQTIPTIKVAFAVFPGLFETDKAFIVKKINELGEAQKVKVFLDNQMNKYSNSQISIYFKINKRLYGYNFKGKNNVEFQMIPTGTRGFEQSMIYDINDLNLFGGFPCYF
ncbi:MAG: hypothetical protein IPP71_07030 [Bacteroidetes bacterium]|nr:hypothetical protein [Bacteroidota bacterium]